MQLINHTITTMDGVSHELLLNQTQDDNQPLLLCMPAMGVAARHYKALVEALNAEGIAAGITEWRGIGSSSVRASRRLDFGYYELLELDVMASIELIKTLYPNKPIYLFGHSLGGQLGTLFLADKPALVEGLISVASGLPFYKGWSFPNNVSLWLGSKLMKYIAKLVGHFPGRKVGFAGREARQVISDWAYSVETGNYRVAGKAKVFLRPEKPAFMMTIDDDILAPPKSAQMLGDKISKSLVEYLHLKAEDLGEDCLGHFKWMEKPQPIAKRINQWLSKQVVD